MVVAGTVSSAQACWLFGRWCGCGSGYSSYYSGYTPYTTNYYGSYGYGSTYNTFTPLVRSPYYYGGYRSSFYRNYNSYYSPVYGYGGCGCSPCSGSPCGSGCSTGNCGVTSSSAMSPEPDAPPKTDEAPMPTYDPNDPMNRESVPQDDPAFRAPRPGQDKSQEAFKPGIPDGESKSDAPSGDSSPAADPLKDKESLQDKSNGSALQAPDPSLNLKLPQLGDPRNSAGIKPLERLDRKITWRSEGVIVRQTRPVPTSRPLLVRRAVRVIPRTAERPASVRHVVSK